MTNLHVLFLTDNFPPETNAPASRTYEHCREWVAAGTRVTVVTCAPNFGTGKVFPGYRNRLWGSETVDGIRVIRVWSYIARNEGVVRRTVDFLSFMATGAVAALFVRADVVVGTSPQFFTVCAASFVAKVKRLPWVFELRDLWPESITAVGAMKDSAALRLLTNVEYFLYRSADLIVPVTHAFRAELERRGIAAAKIEVVTNGVDLANFVPRPKDEALLRELGLEGCFVLGYIGTHGLAQGLETLLDAAERLQDDAAVARVRLLFLGDGARKADLVADAQRRGLRNVLFLDPVSKSEVRRYWSILDASVIHLQAAELFTSVIPSKLFECMGMGIPVLHGVPGESAEIVLKEQAGVVFPSGDARRLANEIVGLLADPARLAAYSRNAVAAAARYDRRSLAKAMLSAIEKVTSECAKR